MCVSFQMEHSVYNYEKVVYFLGHAKFRRFFGDRVRAENYFAARRCELECEDVCCIIFAAVGSVELLHLCRRNVDNGKGILLAENVIFEMDKRQARELAFCFV